jgi:signal transduction histidine kinase/CheY-like chemotaxis protein
VRIFPRRNLAYRLALLALIAALPLALVALAHRVPPAVVIFTLAVSLIAAHAYARGKMREMAALADMAGRVGGNEPLPAPFASSVAQIQRAAVEEAERTRDVFIATLSHELRGTLTAMLGWLETARARIGERATLEKALDIVLRNARQQARIMDDLLDVSRIVSGKLELSAGPLELARLAREAIETAAPAAAEKAIALRLAAHEPVFIEGDRARMLQVIGNLLGNAIKFGKAGGWVSVSVERAGAQARVTVADNGLGIAPEALPHVFERFWQAHPAAPRARRGLGLGLALVRDIVELHGGRCRAESMGPGRGAHFTLELPLLANLLQSLSPEAGDDAECYLNGLGVVALDQNDDTLSWLQHLLATHGAMTWKAHTVDEAVALVAREHADILISDCALVGPGEELIRALHAAPAQKRVSAVVFSSHPTEEECRRALAAGYDAFVAKPCDPGVLLRAVKAAVERRRA